jgi:hypothetical protein
LEIIDAFFCNTLDLFGDHILAAASTTIIFWVWGKRKKTNKIQNRESTEDEGKTLSHYHYITRLGLAAAQVLGNMLGVRVTK